MHCQQQQTVYRDSRLTWPVNCDNVRCIIHCCLRARCPLEHGWQTTATNGLQLLMQLTQNDMKTQRVVFKAFYAESGIPSKTVDKTGIQHHPVKVTPILIGSVDTKKKKKQTHEKTLFLLRRARKQCYTRSTYGSRVHQYGLTVNELVVAEE